MYCTLCCILLLLNSGDPYTYACVCVFNVQQDVDDGHLEAVDLALELEDLMGKLDFLRVGYDEVTMGLILIALLSSLFFATN